LLSQRLANPLILALVGTYEKDQVVPCSVVGVQKVCDNPQKPETPGKNEKLILIAKLGEDGVLEFLRTP